MDSELIRQQADPNVRSSEESFRVTSVLNAPGKRLLDIVGSAFLLIVTAPFLLVIAAIIRIDGGPAFYPHVRMGRNGVPFPCWKFRTMVVGAEEMITEYLRYNPEAKAEWEGFFFLKSDPRVTPIGEFLRKTSLDEIPQLWNVLLGHMSLVGPRPVMAKELVNHYGTLAPLVTSVRPGITGIWQLKGRYKVSYESRVAMDVEYVRTRSLLMDVAILFRTASLKGVLRPENMSDAETRAVTHQP